jgi:hypothetical protein
MPFPYPTPFLVVALVLCLSGCVAVLRNVANAKKAFQQVRISRARLRRG